MDKFGPKEHVIAANEGGAFSIGIGYHLSTGKIPLVYLQNSGLGNLINPLLSISAKEVYSIPALLLIGWRGEPGVKDEPQHAKQGLVNESLLKSLDVPYIILDQHSDFKNDIKSLITKVKKYSIPGAILVRKNTFSKYSYKWNGDEELELVREDALKIIIDQLSDSDVVISTTGKTSREVFEIRETNHQSHKTDFLTIGGMGHTSQIALGIAIQKLHSNVYCIDGDGSVIMHMGSLAIIGSSKLPNFKHIVLNNGSHESVGGQPTVARLINLERIAKDCGYAFSKSVRSMDRLKVEIKNLIDSTGPGFLEIMIKQGSRPDLGRPTIPPIENKKDYMNFLINDKK
jgi:phosphonopyruvate decarboxylase